MGYRPSARADGCLISPAVSWADREFQNGPEPGGRPISVRGVYPHPAATSLLFQLLPVGTLLMLGCAAWWKEESSAECERMPGPLIELVQPSRWPKTSSTRCPTTVSPTLGHASRRIGTTEAY